MNEWIKHDGLGPPIGWNNTNPLVSVRKRNGLEFAADRDYRFLGWHHNKLFADSDIVEYKIEDNEMKMPMPTQQQMDEQRDQMIKAQMNAQKFNDQVDIALKKQAGGDHYKNMGIQPIEYIYSNNLDFLQGNVVKYISRHKAKNGREDVEKALHYCELILELQYKESK